MNAKTRKWFAATALAVFGGLVTQLFVTVGAMGRIFDTST